MGWKPREEYKTLAERHDVILTRCRDGHTGPMLVIWREGHFVVCPGIPILYGANTCGFWTHDHFDEWTEIPE